MTCERLASHPVSLTRSVSTFHINRKFHSPAKKWASSLCWLQLEMSASSWVCRQGHAHSGWGWWTWCLIQRRFLLLLLSSSSCFLFLPPLVSFSPSRFSSLLKIILCSTSLFFSFFLPYSSPLSLYPSICASCFSFLSSIIPRILFDTYCLPDTVVGTHYERG